MYLGETQYRIHGTNDPTTIGKKVSSGCVRLTNDDVIDLYGRTNVGTKVIVLPETSPRLSNEEVGRGDNRQDGRQDGRQLVSSQAVSPQIGSSQIPPAGSSRRIFTETGPVASAFGLY
jgi:hypothetical protein